MFSFLEKLCRNFVFTMCTILYLLTNSIFCFWQSQIESLDSVCIILGNESCDLDSAVCALVFAYFLEQKQKFASVHLPVLNVAKEDYVLKTEVVYFLKRFCKLMITVKSNQILLFLIDSTFRLTSSYFGRFCVVNSSRSMPDNALGNNFTSLFILGMKFASNHCKKMES